MEATTAFLKKKNTFYDSNRECGQSVLPDYLRQSDVHVFRSNRCLLLSNQTSAKFSLVSILKIFSLFGVFSVIPYGMTLNFNLERDIKARI